jgi:hypothetical protein
MTKKKNSFLVAISWILTILSLLAWAQSSQISTPYGSPASSPAFILGLFALPGLSWLITYLTARTISSENSSKEKQASYNYSVKLTDPEAHSLQQKINNYTIELNRIKKDGDLLNRSIDQNLITESKYNDEMDRLDATFYAIHNKKTICENRLKAITQLSEELENLEELCKKGIISVYSKESKRSEMINAYIRNLS